MAAKPKGHKTNSDRVERAYKNTSGDKKTDAKQRKKNLILIGSTLFLLIAAVTAGFFLFWEKDDGLILPNVSVAGVDVGGMTKESALEAVNQATKYTYSQNNMVVKVNDHQEEISPSDSGVLLNVEAAVEVAYQYGRTGNSKQRAQDKLESVTGIVVDILPYLNLDMDAIQSSLDTLAAHYSSLLTETTYQVTGSYDPETGSVPTLTITKGTPEYNLDMDVLTQKVLDAYNTNCFSVEMICEAIQPQNLDLQAIFDEHCIAAKDAIVDPQTFDVTPATDGCEFSISEVEEKLKAAAPGEELTIPFTKTKGNTEESDKLYRDVLGHFTTTASGSSNRNNNLKRACESINGKILLPNDVFSYNYTLGERTEANGYRPGASYSGNETITTYGGGICQVSSTLYYCTLVADLEIIERSNHGFYPGYIPLGMDATVSWNALDFKFRNNTNYPIRIEAEASGGSVTISLVGTDEKDYEIKMEYRVLNTTSYKVTYETMTADNEKGYKDGDEIVSGYTGYEVETYKCKYSKATGELISKDIVNTSKYRSRDQVICKIEEPKQEETKPTEPTTPPPGLDGTGGGITPDE